MHFRAFSIRMISVQIIFRLHWFPCMSFRAFYIRALSVQSTFSLEHFHLEQLPVFGENSKMHFRAFSIRMFSDQITFRLDWFPFNAFRPFSIRALSVQSIFSLEHFHLEHFPVCKNLAKIPFRTLSIRSFSRFVTHFSIRTTYIRAISNQSTFHQIIFLLDQFPIRSVSNQNIFHQSILLQSVFFRTKGIRAVYAPPLKPYLTYLGILTMGVIWLSWGTVRCFKCERKTGKGEKN